MAKIVAKGEKISLRRLVERAWTKEKVIALALIIASIIVIGWVVVSTLTTPNVLIPAKTNSVLITAKTIGEPFENETVDVKIFDKDFVLVQEVKLTAPLYTARVSVELMYKFYITASVEGFYWVDKFDKTIVKHGSLELLEVPITNPEEQVELTFAKQGSYTINVFNMTGLIDNKTSEFSVYYDVNITGALANFTITAEVNYTYGLPENVSERNDTFVVEYENVSIPLAFNETFKYELHILENLAYPVEVIIHVSYINTAGELVQDDYIVVFS